MDNIADILRKPRLVLRPVKILPVQPQSPDPLMEQKVEVIKQQAENDQHIALPELIQLFQSQHMDRKYRDQPVPERQKHKHGNKPALTKLVAFSLPEQSRHDQYGHKHPV